MAEIGASYICTGNMKKYFDERIIFDEIEQKILQVIKFCRILIS
jgi:hypothetical protein